MRKWITEWPWKKLNSLHHDQFIWRDCTIVTQFWEKSVAMSFSPFCIVCTMGTLRSAGSKLQLIRIADWRTVLALFCCFQYKYPLLNKAASFPPWHSAYYDYNTRCQKWRTLMPNSRNICIDWRNKPRNRFPMTTGCTSAQRRHRKELAAVQAEVWTIPDGDRTSRKASTSVNENCTTADYRRWRSHWGI